MKAEKVKKKAKKSRGKKKFDKWKYSVKENKAEMLQQMSRHVSRDLMNKAQLMFELAECVVAAIDADIFRVYVVETDGYLSTYRPHDEQNRSVWTFISRDQIMSRYLSVQASLPYRRGLHGGRVLRRHQDGGAGQAAGRQVPRLRGHRAVPRPPAALRPRQRQGGRG